MKIIGTMVVGRGEGDRWLKAALEQFKMCDVAVIVQNNVDLKTKKVIKDTKLATYQDNREWGENQPKIKESLARFLARFSPDWVLSLDADEFLEKRLTRQKLEELASAPHDIAYYFWFVELWNREDQHRTDYLFEDVRFWKYLPAHLKFRNTNVHCGMAPEMNYRWGTRSEYFVRHYGLLRAKDRLKKVKRYESYDPEGKILPKAWYEGLKARHPPLEQFIEEEFIKKLPKTLFRKKPMPYAGESAPKKNWKFINPHGRLIIFDKEAHYRQRLNAQGWKFLGEEDVFPSLGEVPVVETPVEHKAEFSCDQCGFVGKSQHSLIIHKGKQHK